ncbi:MAG: RagB/SusD family nutrient uptake outer membrane protein [Muribaculaceae bacterium]|nr:RagB/SusD family nutrient uptake outer membrane protein [Muribaculaceae bacterium]
MKLLNKNIIAILAGFLMLTSCFGDLDTMPLDDNQLVSEQVYKTKDGYMGVLAKCYSSLILTGQKGGDGGDGDLEGANEGYSGYVRLMFYMTELNTDNCLMPSSSNGLRKCLNLQWDASNASVITWTYQRLYMAIAYSNEFLRECTPSKMQDRGVWSEMNGEYLNYRAEARFIRAYCYATLCDLFGSVPFIDETVGVKDIPVQQSRAEIFKYAENELKEIAGESATEQADKDVLKEAGQNEYARVDKAAAWFLLSRMYLNAESWINENHYNDCLTYSNKVIDSGKYPLASDYRHIFLADNNDCKEIVWRLVQDGQKAQSSAGTNFYVKAFVNGPMNELYQTGVGSKGWGNVRAKTTLVAAFDASDVEFNTTDTWGNNKNDKRAQFMTALPNQKKETWDDNEKMTSTFTCGFGYIKWRNVTKDDKISASGDTYSSIDYPMFRTADAYLMAAEAILRGANGSRATALDYINEVRMRAYMSDKYAVSGVSSKVSGKITDSQLTLDFILGERQRELATELVRRTDLIRFNKFTTGNNWDWKNGERLGTDVDKKYELFPIPESELTNNPTLKQNDGYSNK